MNIIVNRKKKRNVLVSLCQNQLSEYDKLFLDIFDGYKIKELEVYPNVLYMKGDTTLIDYDKKTKNAYINNKLIWYIFESRFSLNDQEIRELMRGLLETHLKLKGTSPVNFHSIVSSGLETHLKL